MSSEVLGCEQPGPSVHCLFSHSIHRWGGGGVGRLQTVLIRIPWAHHWVSSLLCCALHYVACVDVSSHLQHIVGLLKEKANMLKDYFSLEVGDVSACGFSVLL